MIECETCGEWFHGSCIGIEEHSVPDHYHCDTCADPVKLMGSKQLEDTIVEALSLLAGQGAHRVKSETIDLDQENTPENLNRITRYNSSTAVELIARLKPEEAVVPSRKKLMYSNDVTNVTDRMIIDGSPRANGVSSSATSSPLRPGSSPSSPIFNGSYGDLSPINSSSEHDLSPPLLSSPSSRRSHNVTKTYTRKNKKQITILERYYAENSCPDASMIHAIATEANLPEQKVSRWFYDKRRRSKQLQSMSY